MKKMITGVLCLMLVLSACKTQPADTSSNNQDPDLGLKFQSPVSSFSFSKEESSTSSRPASSNKTDSSKKNARPTSSAKSASKKNAGASSSTTDQKDLPDWRFTGESYDSYGYSKFLTEYKGVIYHRYLGDMRIYRTTKNSAEAFSPKLSSGRMSVSVNSYHFTDGFLYYSTVVKDVYEMYKIPLGDHSKPVFLGNGCIGPVVGQWLYYIDDQRYISRMKTDGTGAQKLLPMPREWNHENNDYYNYLPDTTNRFKVDQDKLYYNTESGLYQYDIRKKTTKQLVDKPCYAFFIMDHSLYYKLEPYNGSWNELTASNKQTASIFDDQFLFVMNGYVYKLKTTSQLGHADLYCRKIGTNKDILIQKDFSKPDDPLYICTGANGWIYYFKNDGIYKMRVDGTDVQKCGLKTPNGL